MTTNFPAALDTLANPSPTDPMNSVTVPHAEQHANANDAIEAIQAKVGVDESADPSSLDHRVAAVEAGKETAGAAAAAIAAHEGSSDPHSQYLTAAQADASYVNVAGDDMTGPLNITAGTTPQVLTVTGSYKDATQVIPNSEFADASSWTLSGGWIIDGGRLKNPTAVIGNISVPLTGLVAGASYVIEVGMPVAGCYFFPSSDGGVTQKSYWRYWESPHFGFVAPSANFTLTLSQNYVAAAVEIDYIRMYKVIANADRVQRGTSATSTAFDLTASGTSFGLGENSLRNAGNAMNSIAIGKNAMAVTVRPYDAIAIGTNAMQNSQGPSNNIAIGSLAMRDVGPGANNVVIGTSANYPNVTGNENSVVGHSALMSAVGANYNTGIGFSVLSSITSGSDNVAVGLSVGSILTGGGSQNTMVGSRILRSGTSGAYSSLTLLGYGAGGATPYSSSVCLGAGAVVTGNNQLQLGASGYTSYAYGAVQDRSDRRDKSDIRPTILGLDFIKALTPVDFKWDMRDDYRTEIPEALSDRLFFLEREKRGIKESGGDVTGIKAEIDAIEAQIASIVQGNLLDKITQDGRKKRTRYHHGLIAQDVRKVMNDMGIDFGGFQNHKLNGGQDALSIGYTELIAPMIRAIQQQQAMIEALQARVAALEA